MQKRNLFFLLFILAVGIFLRVYGIGINYYFSGELGKELLYLRQFSLSGTLPLVGMTTSHEWLYYGPVYYWVLLPIFKFVSQSPFMLFYAAVGAWVAGAIITFFVFSKICGKRFAQVLVFFIAVSPLWIWTTRLSKLHTFFFILIPLVVYFLYRIWKGDKKVFVWLGISYGLLFSFHYSHLPLILVILYEFYLKRKTIKIKEYLEFFAGVVLPNITVLVYDAMQHFFMTKDLILWIPYKVLIFLGIYKIVKPEIITTGTTPGAFNEFLGRNLFWDSRFWIIGSVVFVIMFIAFFIENRKKFQKDFFTFYLISTTSVQFIALIIQTSPPIHYFLPIFLNFGLLFAYYVNKYWAKPSVRFLTALIFVLIAIVDILNIKKEHAFDTDYVPLAAQEKVVGAIISDANGKPFKLSRVGPFDYFPDEYKQNYEYLILRQGGKIDPNSSLMYTIFDQGGSPHVLKGV